MITWDVEVHAQVVKSHLDPLMASRMGQRENLLAQILVHWDIDALAMEQEVVGETPRLSERHILQLLA
jgi:hypothetical protein